MDLSTLIANLATDTNSTPAIASDTGDRKSVILTTYREMGRTYTSDKGYECLNSFYNADGTIKRAKGWFDVMKKVNAETTAAMKASGWVEGRPTREEYSTLEQS